MARGRRRVVSRRRPPQRAEPEAGPETLAWSVHLARDRPKWVVGLVVLMAGCAALCFYLFGSLLYAAFTVVALLGATAEFLFPAHYRLTREAAEMRNLHNWRRIAWAEVRKVYLLDEGIKLSPLPHAGPREAFRGLMLRWQVEDGSTELPSAATILAFVEQRVAEAGALQTGLAKIPETVGKADRST